MVKINFTTATELCQIERSEPGSVGKPSTIIIKKEKVITKNSKGNKVFLETPFYSGNSVRGKLRRICAGFLIKKGIEKGIEIKKEKITDFHLMNVGGGNDFQRQLFETVDKVRDLNPVLSVFGASLAISGKIKTSNFIPYKSFVDGVPEYYAYETEDGRLFSSIEYDDNFYKMDDLLDKKGNAKLVSDDVIMAWRERAEENIKLISASRDENNDEKNSSNKKIKKETIKSQLRRKFVIRGVDFYGSFGEIEELSPVERGMIYKAIEVFVLENLGANEARNFGLVNYNIEYKDGSILETKVNEFLEPVITKKAYNDEVMSSINAFNEWLETLSEENLFISDVLV